MKLKAPPGMTHIQTHRAAYPVADGLIEVDPRSPDIPYLLEKGFAETDAPPPDFAPSEQTEPDAEPDHTLTTKRPKRAHTNKENDNE